MSDKKQDGCYKEERVFAPPLLHEVYDLLFSVYGPQGWWPLVSKAGRDGFDCNGYHPGIVYVPDFYEAFEIAAGAVLVQNTAWSNASIAVKALYDASLLSPVRLADTDTESLFPIVRSSGYFRQKSIRLKALASFFAGLSSPPTRAELMDIKGIGKETADSILLYGFDKPFFVVDAYTRRIFYRLGYLSDEKASYDFVASVFTEVLDKDTELYREYHALIVEHAKRYCRKKPCCHGCPLANRCAYYKDRTSESSAADRL
ncbi:DNA repair protein [Spirochaetia bacterium 38H-sp]|uniref:DNA repair protein n=1 Tax=Rarispira pelagica TaxID=3141764 RepID=A0ABU9UCZ2_9SPIR